MTTQSWRAAAGVLAVAGVVVLAPAARAGPPNDAIEHAQAIGSLPAVVEGTTKGSRAGENEPGLACANVRGSVWYTVRAPRRGPMVARVKAAGTLDASVAVYHVVRSRHIPLICRTTNRHGRAVVPWYAYRDGSYLIAVGQRIRSEPDSFRLTVQAAEPAPRAPGRALPTRGVASTVDPVLDASDAWALAMERGTTYRINLTTLAGCVALELYRPNTYSFALARPEQVADCGGYVVFTPGLDGGGVYSLVVKARGSRPQRHWYRLQAARAGPDDTAPGVKLENGSSVEGSIFGRGLDVVDLYRFNVPRDNELTTLALQQKPNVGLDLVVLDETGGDVTGAVGHSGRQVLRDHLAPGRYFAAVRSREKSGGRYRLTLLIRDVTTTSISAAGSRFTEVAPATLVPLSVVVTSASHGGTVQVEIDRHDPLAGWLYSTVLEGRVGLTGAATLNWTPPSVGHWRARARFVGNPFSSFSESGYVGIHVAEPLE